ncbi:MAG: NAD(P)-dependent oxidoreductase [Clostridiales bacterium]|nr:NAD(P)-dependent oxidoreductase [Clostridiales bacterium]
MKKRIAVTGGTGFIGQYLIRDFGDEYDFIVPTSRSVFDGLCTKARYVQSDYSRADFLNYFRECDAVIHLGGYVIKGSDKDLITKPYINNISLAADVFSACEELSIKNVVCASSVAVYKQAEGHPLKENDILKPNSMYGVSKVAIEQMAELYNSMYGMSIKNLRYAQVLGYRRQVFTQFYGMLLRNASQGLPITVWGEGIAARDVIYVRDAARAAIAAVEHPTVCGSYNIGSGRAVSNMELAEAYTKGFDSSAPVSKIPVEHEDSHIWCVNCEKAAVELDFTPDYSMLEMARDMKHEMEIDQVIRRT